MAKRKFTEGDLASLIKQKHSGPAWAVAFDVANATGWKISRRLDAVAMGLWPSKGLDLHGFEIKTRRSDWMREIQDPEKAAAFSVYLDYFWIVAAPGVVKLEEMPGSWGLMVPHGAGLRVKKAAEKTPSEPLSRPIMAGLLRAFNDQGRAKEFVKAKEREAYERGRKDEEAHANRRERTATHSLEALRKGVQDFERASGIQIHSYEGKYLGHKVELLRRLGVERVLGVADHVAGELERTVKRLRDEIEFVSGKLKEEE